MNIISGRIGYGRAKRIESVILEHTRYEGMRSCDEYGIYREACITLGKFGAAARDSIPIIKKMKSDNPKCWDIVRYVDEALELVDTKNLNQVKQND